MITVVAKKSVLSLVIVAISIANQFQSDRCDRSAM